MVASLFIHKLLLYIVDDKNGNTLNSHSDVCARWRCHFFKVLNIPSCFKEEVLNSVIQLPLRDHLDDVSSCEEVQFTISNLKGYKAAGGSVIVEKFVELFYILSKKRCKCC